MVTSRALTRYRCPTTGVAGRQFAAWFQLLQMQRMAQRGMMEEYRALGKKENNKISISLFEISNRPLMKLTDYVQLGGLVSHGREEQ